MKPRIYIIDDEPAICVALTLLLEDSYTVQSFTDADEGIRQIQKLPPELVLLDLRIGERNGIDVLDEIKGIDSSVAVIMMTAYGDIRSSVEAMKRGAFSYLAKPLDAEELGIYIRQALEFRHLNEKVTHLSGEVQRQSYGEMIGKSPAMQQLYQMIERIKDTDVSVTILGESGTGKELAARAIHFKSRRSKGAFVAVNCASIPEGLLEEEFFGHKKGSFTGAVSDRVGKFELANGGTLFLDEIGDMPLALQAKLLRVLQQKEFTPIGSNVVQKTDVRIVAATNIDLRQRVADGTFREDLFYRLNVVELRLPPLRERRQDIPLLCRSLLQKYSENHGTETPTLSHEAERLLLSYRFPGNIRELCNAMEYAVILSGKKLIEVNDLPPLIRGAVAEEATTEAWPAPNTNWTLEKGLQGLTLQEIEKIAIQAALSRNNGKQKITAQQLGISERGLRYKIQEYGLDKGRRSEASGESEASDK